MSLTFGVKKADEPEYIPGEDGEFKPYLMYFKEGTTRLRFLEEPDKWTMVWMHFNAAKKRDYPCTGERDTCPGCNSEDEREAKASKRYLVNARFYDEGQEEYKYTNVYKIPVSIIDDLDRSMVKRGTLMDRDYEIIRYKRDGQTKYSIDQCDKSPFDFDASKEDMKSHQELLADAFREVWGGLPGEDDYTGDEEVFGLKPKKSKAPEYGEPTFSKSTQADVHAEWEMKVEQINSMDEDELISMYDFTGTPLPKKRTRKALIKGLIQSLSA